MLFRIFAFSQAGADSMGGVIDGGVEVSSAPSLQQSLDLEKTQAVLRETFSAADKFRRELEFLQKGGDPLDLKFGSGASVSLQSTSLTDRHPEQFVASEVKGSVRVTASPHGDSVESSGRLGVPSVCEPNSADNLMLFDGDNRFHEVERSLHPPMNNNNSTTSEHYSQLNVGRNAKQSGESVALELPKKSYKRRIRSRPNRDVARSSSTDAGPCSGQSLFSSQASRIDADNQEQKYLSISNSKPKSPNVGLALKSLASNSCLDVKLNGMQTQKPTLGPYSDASVSQHFQENQHLTSDTRETPLSVSSLERVGTTERKNDCNGFLANGLDSKSSCNQTDLSNNRNEVQKSIIFFNSNGTMELNIASNEASNLKGNNLNMTKDEDGSTLKEEEGLNGSESELKKSVLSTEKKACFQNSPKVATKDEEDSILKEARIIEEKRKKIARLSVGICSLESRHRSHWNFVLEEMSWLANDFAQERLWKVAAAAQISQRAAYTSWVRFQQQKSLWKQKEVAHTLAKAVLEFWHSVQVKCQGLDLEGCKNDSTHALLQYGMRFVEFNTSCVHYNSAQALMTTDRIYDLVSVDISWEDNLTEENLFYTVPPGAIEAYRKSIESHLLQFERTGSSMQEEADAYLNDAAADNTLEEDEEETSTYYLPGAFEGSRVSKTAQKNRKQSNSYGGRSYEMGADLSFTQSLERNIGFQPSMLIGKRPTSSINVSIPTKRVRTASRQRFMGTSGYIRTLNRTDASSGDTNSFQDEQSSLQNGSQIQNNMEAESAGDYEKQFHFDMAEVSNRPKKKKGSMFEHRWQLHSNFQNDQKDHLKRRLDAPQFDSNGNSVPSQMSNMSNSIKFMKLLVRDRGRKAKSLKSLQTPGGQQGSRSPWSSFEDQALVVLVHDLGANWELISDAMNSILQFKCISRNSKECKEHHKMLMDRNTGDGADSAEDSGSSQPYPSPLNGIPEGSARQLFQRLHGPMEEDTLKSHFEKIIMISQKRHRRNAHNYHQDPKQLQQPHGSHALTLSQVFPNNLNGGPVLTPLDLCDAISSAPDFPSVGYQGPNNGGPPIQNHNNIAPPMVPGSSSTSSLSGSSSLVHGSHLASASAPLSPSIREGRYAIPRMGSLSIDEQHRYNQMLSARNIQHSSLPPGSHSGTDCGPRMLPSGNGMGGINRMTRPGFQGISNPSMMNSGVPIHNKHLGAAPGQGNLVRPHEAVRMMRPNQITSHQRQINGPDLQMVQGSQSGMVSSPNQNAQHQEQDTHPMSPQQSPQIPNSNSHKVPQNPAYNMRIMKERQLQQQRLLKQFGTSNAMMPHLQPQQSQIPVSSLQSSTQIQSLSPKGTPKNPMSQHPQKHFVPAPQRLLPHQFQQTKVMKGGGRGTIHQNNNNPVNPSLLNGFSGDQSDSHMLQSDQGNLYSVPSGNPIIQAASKQSMQPHSPLNESPQLKRRPNQPQSASSKQLQQQKHSHSSDTNNNLSPQVVPSSSKPQAHMKLVNQTQSKAAQRMVQNQRANSSDLPTSKLHFSQTNTNITSSERPDAGAPHQKKSEPFYDSSGAVSDDAAQFEKVPIGMSSQSSSDHSGPAANHGGVNKQIQISSDNLPNSVGQDASVQWQQQLSS